MKDKNVLDVVSQFIERSEHGFKKYGVTTERTDIDLNGWLQHLKEELMDAVVYINRAQQELKEKDKGMITYIPKQHHS